MNKILKERNELPSISNEWEVMEGKDRNIHLIWEQVCWCLPCGEQFTQSGRAEAKLKGTNGEWEAGQIFQKVYGTKREDKW